VRGSDVTESLGVELDQQGRVVVTDNLSIAVFPDVYVIGDLAHVIDSDSQQQVPGVAPAAIQMGQYVAMDICRKHAKEINYKPFVYRDKGTMATIGRNHAVAIIGGRQFSGFFAWLIWGIIHIVPLISFRRKISVLLAWLWSYFSVSKDVRLITGKPRVKIKKSPGAVSRSGEKVS
ncbi:MAG: FAD-dependent oxidoreductase, partial [Desulfuromusa sp.]